MASSITQPRKLPLVLHILAWIIILVLPWYLVNTMELADRSFLYHYYLNTILYGLFFYVNYLILVPRFYFDEKKFRYFAILIFLVVALSVLLYYLNDALFQRTHGPAELGPAMDGGAKIDGPPRFEDAPQIDDPRRIDGPGRGDRPGRRPVMRFMSTITHLSTLGLLTGFSLGLGVLERFRSNEKERKEMEKEMLNAELALLKNQVSPHFFFNTLNNIYSLIQFDSQKAGETVHKLSKLMRYLLYDSDKDLTGLEDEIQFMQNYIELMQLRLNEKVSLRVDLPEDPPSLQIPPLLFIPVIENAFKHGISYREDSFIEVAMHTNREKLLFRARNSLVEGKTEMPEEHTGIGLENVRKRLNLLFPGTHELRIEPGDDDFLVEIVLNTKDLGT